MRPFVVLEAEMQQPDGYGKGRRAREDEWVEGRIPHIYRMPPFPLLNRISQQLQVASRASLAPGQPGSPGSPGTPGKLRDGVRYRGIVIAPKKPPTVDIACMGFRTIAPTTMEFGRTLARFSCSSLPNGKHALSGMDQSATERRHRD